MKPLPQVLMLEGPDGTGKTTIADSLGCHYRHYGPPRFSTWEQEFLLDIEEDAARYSRVVHDRGVYGNAVWAEALGTTRLVDVLNIALVVGALNMRVRHRVVFLRRPRHEIAAELRSRGEAERQVRAALASIPLYEGLALTLGNMGVDVHILNSQHALRAPSEWWWAW